MRLLLQRPRYLASMAAALMVQVLPAPTAWSSSVLPENRIRATAFFCHGRMVMAGFILWNRTRSPSKVGGT